MKTFNHTITDPLGLHARPAGMLVLTIKKFSSAVTIKKGEKTANAVRLMGLMGLGIKSGDEVTIEVCGEDEEAAVSALEEFFKKNL